jgi:hypothetical protein
MEPDVVRHNLDTDRIVTACACGRTVSLPGSGLSEHLCECGRGWKCDGSLIAMYVPREWTGGEGGLADG